MIPMSDQIPSGDVSASLGRPSRPLSLNYYCRTGIRTEGVRGKAVDLANLERNFRRRPNQIRSDRKAKVWQPPSQLACF